MDTIKIILLLIGSIISAVGVVFIFDARNISKKWFSFGDQNDSSKWLKLIGFIVTIIGGIIIFLNI